MNSLQVIESGTANTILNYHLSFMYYPTSSVSKFSYISLEYNYVVYNVIEISFPSGIAKSASSFLRFFIQTANYSDECTICSVVRDRYHILMLVSVQEISHGLWNHRGTGGTYPPKSFTYHACASVVIIIRTFQRSNVHSLHIIITDE